MIHAFFKELKVMLLSIKYCIAREMLNKVTFLTNIIFMVLNNATFILEWVILFSIKSEIGGYGFKEIMLLWGFAAGTYGVCHVFFGKATGIADLIINGELDTFLVQPKDVLLSVLSSKSDVSAIGDLIYSYIMLFIYGFTFPRFILYTIGIFCGGLIFTSTLVIYHSLSFWFVKMDVIQENANMIMINFATYPGTVFKGGVKLILYTLVPAGIADYIPLDLMIHFDASLFVILLIATFSYCFLAYGMFNRGLRRYSSSNLMNARV